MNKTKLRTKKSVRSVPLSSSATYRGKLAKTGNSLGFRFESALFQSHPEFNGAVEARVIGPGRMLVVAGGDRGGRDPEEDPVLSSFLSFLAAEMARSLGRIRPFDPALSKRIKNLVKSLQNSPEEDLGDEALI